MTPYDRLAGLEVRVSPHLAGSKRGIRQGNVVYVSPAMWELMRHADPDELRLLMEKIEVLTIPEPRLDVPLTTQPPPADAFKFDMRPWRFGL